MEKQRKRKLPWAIVLLILVFCVGIAFGAAYLWRNIADQSSFGSANVVALDSITDLQCTSDGFVYYDGSAVSKYTDDGKSSWSYMVGSNAGMDVSDEGVAVWVGQKLTLIDGDSGVADFSGNLDDDILSAKLGSVYAAVQTGEEDNSTIVLMESGGTQVDTISVTDQYVIDYGFFYNDSLFWVMILDTTGTTPSVTVETYRPGRRLVGSISDVEQIIYHVVFQSNQICTTGDTYVSVYDYSGTEDTSRQILVYGWTLAASDDDDDNPMLAFTLNGEYDADELMQDVRMIRGTNDQIVRFPYGCSSLVASGNRVYGFSSEGYVMIAYMGRSKVSAYQLPITFDTVYGVTDNNIAVVGYGSTIYLVSLE